MNMLMKRNWRRTRAKAPDVSESLVSEIDDTLARLDACRSEYDALVLRKAPLATRRIAYAELERAFTDADVPLRQATRLARARSYAEWRLWRSRLSRLDLARQDHLFAGSDALTVLPQGEVRTIDTGMAGPAIGDLIHGETRPGAPATYGLDMDLTLGATSEPVPAHANGSAAA